MKTHYLFSMIFCLAVFTLFSCKEENQPPTCEITTPANTQEFSIGDDIIISADAEWKVLEGIVDTQYPVGDPEWDDYGWRGYDTGTQLKSTTGWSDIGNGDNSSGFIALPGGYRSIGTGAFGNAGYNGYCWSATEYSSNDAWYRSLGYSYVDVGCYNFNKSIGISVRCLWDN